MVYENAEKRQLSSHLCRRTMALDSSRDEPSMRYEIEIKKYTGMEFAKNPLIIKLEWNSIEVYRKRIQLESSFWDKNCVPPSFGLCGFYSICIHCLNE